MGTESEPEDDEPGLRVEAREDEHETARPDKPAMTLEEPQSYHRGTYFATVAMQKKLEGGAKEKMHAYQNLVNEYNAAIRETAKRLLTPGRAG